VTTKLLPKQKNHQEKQKQLQQQESGNNIAVTATADIFLSLSELFESDRQELAN
jgi:predicted metallo-beta-lactamase superfamily hydrolase